MRAGPGGAEPWWRGSVSPCLHVTVLLASACCIPALCHRSPRCGDSLSGIKQETEGDKASISCFGACTSERELSACPVPCAVPQLLHRGVSQGRKHGAAGGWDGAGVLCTRGWFVACRAVLLLTGTGTRERTSLHITRIVVQVPNSGGPVCIPHPTHSPTHSAPAPAPHTAPLGASCPVLSSTLDTDAGCCSSPSSSATKAVLWMPLFQQADDCCFLHDGLFRGASAHALHQPITPQPLIFPARWHPEAVLGQLRGENPLQEAAAKRGAGN